MNKAFILTALVLGSSTAASADTTFSGRARIEWNTGFHTTTNAGPVVRDHRDARAGQRAPRVRAARYATGFNREWTYDRGPFHGGSAPQPEMPPLVGPSWDCHNWDPTVEVDSVCTAFASSDARPLPTRTYGWTALGVRESSVPSHQYITVERAYSEILLQANSGAPIITKVAVKYMDGTTQVTTMNQRLRGAANVIRTRGGTINQIVIYTDAGAGGSYSVLAR